MVLLLQDKESHRPQDAAEAGEQARSAGIGHDELDDLVGDDGRAPDDSADLSVLANSGRWCHNSSLKAVTGPARPALMQVTVLALA